MSEHYEPLNHTQTPENTPTVLEYSGLVNAVQLGVARLLSVPGSFEARNFSELLEARTPDAQQELMCEVGAKFDQALVTLVTCSLIAAKGRRIVIMADNTEGINGAFPWEPKLQAHLDSLRSAGTLKEPASVEVNRYAAVSEDAVEALAEASLRVAA